ncbi:MAG TPA: YfhO family protein [Acidobacteriota bacterium]
MIRKTYPVLFFAAVTILAFWKVIFHSEFTLLTGGDLASSYYPWFDVASYWLKKGTFLLWDPYVHSGKPFMGEPQPGLFYPLNWVFMLLPSRGGGINPAGLQALLILHYFLAGYFCYLLSRSFQITPSGSALAGVTFALGGVTFQLCALVNILGGFIWLPLVFLFFRRALLAERWQACLRWSLSSGASMALSFLAGHHVPPIHAGFFLLLYAIFFALTERGSVASGPPNVETRYAASPQLDGKSEKGRSPLMQRATPFAVLVAVAVTAAFLTALQWLPSLQWARHVYRWVGEGEPVRWGQKVPYSVLQHTVTVGPQDVASMLVPYASANTNLYLGCFVLFLSLVTLLFVRKRDAQFFGAAAFIYLFLSWGKFTALHGWVNTFVPGMWFARENAHYLIPFQVCIALLAGWGLDYVTNVHGENRERTFEIFLRRAGWTMALLVIGAWAFVLVLHLQKGIPIEHPYMTRVATLAASLTLLGLLLFLLQTGRVRPQLFGALIVLLTILDLSSQISNSIQMKVLPAGQQNTYVGSFWKKPPAADFLISRRQSGEYFRVDDPSSIFPPNFGDVWRLEATMGHGATALVDYFTLRGTGWAPTSNASALLNVRYFLAATDIPGMTRVFNGDASVYFNPHAVPRAFIASRYQAFDRDEELLSWIQTPLFTHRETVLLRKRDLEKLPQPFLAAAQNEQEGIGVREISHLTAADKMAERLGDEDARRLQLLRPPWGWSTGDEIIFSLQLDQPVEHCFLICNFYPTGSAASHLKFRLEGPKGQSTIPMELPGLAAGPGLPEAPQLARIDLGHLDGGQYRFSFVKTEICSANIDSLRISKSDPDSGDQSAGAVKILSYQPNVLKLFARASRPSFLILSEVYYPGWEASVNGRPATLLAADFILRAVPLGEGKHQIELRYRPASFRWGLAMSIISAIGVTVFLFVTRGKS